MARWLYHLEYWFLTFVASLKVFFLIFVIQLNPNFPDFVHKTAKKALWLDSAPISILSILETSKASPVKAHVQSESSSTCKIPLGKMMFLPFMVNINLPLVISFLFRCGREVEGFGGKS